MPDTRVHPAGEERDLAEGGEDGSSPRYSWALVRETIEVVLKDQALALAFVVVLWCTIGLVFVAILYGIHKGDDSLPGGALVWLIACFTILLCTNNMSLLSVYVTEDLDKENLNTMSFLTLAKQVASLVWIELPIVLAISTAGLCIIWLSEFEVRRSLEVIIVTNAVVAFFFCAHYCFVILTQALHHNQTRPVKLTPCLTILTCTAFGVIVGLNYCAGFWIFLACLQVPTWLADQNILRLAFSGLFYPIGTAVIRANVMHTTGTLNEKAGGEGSHLLIEIAFWTELVFIVPGKFLVLKSSESLAGVALSAVIESMAETALRSGSVYVMYSILPKKLAKRISKKREERQQESSIQVHGLHHHSVLSSKSEGPRCTDSHPSLHSTSNVGENSGQSRRLSTRLSAVLRDVPVMTLQRDSEPVHPLYNGEDVSRNPSLTVDEVNLTTTDRPADLLRKQSYASMRASMNDLYALPAEEECDEEENSAIDSLLDVLLHRFPIYLSLHLLCENVASFYIASGILSLKWIGYDIKADAVTVVAGSCICVALNFISDAVTLWVVQVYVKMRAKEFHWRPNDWGYVSFCYFVIAAQSIMIATLGMASQSSGFWDKFLGNSS